MVHVNYLLQVRKHAPGATAEIKELVGDVQTCLDRWVSIALKSLALVHCDDVKTAYSVSPTSDCSLAPNVGYWESAQTAYDAFARLVGNDATDPGQEADKLQQLTGVGSLLDPKGVPYE